MSTQKISSATFRGRVGGRKKHHWSWFLLKLLISIIYNNTFHELILLKPRCISIACKHLPSYIRQHEPRWCQVIKVMWSLNLLSLTLGLESGTCFAMFTILSFHPKCFVSIHFSTVEFSNTWSYWSWCPALKDKDLCGQGFQSIRKSRSNASIT